MTTSSVSIDTITAYLKINVIAKVVKRSYHVPISGTGHVLRTLIVGYKLSIGELSFLSYAYFC